MINLNTNSPYTIMLILKSSYMAWSYDKVPAETYTSMHVASISEFCSARLLSAAMYTLMCAVSSLNVSFPYYWNRS